MLNHFCQEVAKPGRVFLKENAVVRSVLTCEPKQDAAFVFRDGVKMQPTTEPTRLAGIPHILHAAIVGCSDLRWHLSLCWFVVRHPGRLGGRVAGLGRDLLHVRLDVCFGVLRVWQGGCIVILVDATLVLARVRGDWLTAVRTLAIGHGSGSSFEFAPKGFTWVVVEIAWI
jgi:hypothetical protein